jgi:YNFM family putative membrane transporter
MKHGSTIGLQAQVFFLVSAAFTSIYITQPVLPLLQVEFGVNETRASLSISAVIFGIALANLPFGMLADKYRIRPIIIVGGSLITICGLVCAFTGSFTLLVLARFIQGLHIPSLTTCLAAFLAKNLPPERLNVAMGSYVSATVIGGLGGRFLGGWVHPPPHWRYAFISASVLVMVATLVAARGLPREEQRCQPKNETIGFIALLSRWDLLRMYSVAFGAFFVFSSIFNYLPFYLSAPPFNASTQFITLMYLSYIIGIFIGPIAGLISNRIGNGATMALGSIVFALSIASTLIKSMLTIAMSLSGVCAGFFAIHASAVGSLNRRLHSSRGRANSLYVLFYYLGGSLGITVSGYAYLFTGWSGVCVLGILVLSLPFATGLMEKGDRE